MKNFLKNPTNILLVIAIVLSVGLYFKQYTVVNNPTQTVMAVGDTAQTPKMIQTSMTLSTTTPVSTLNTDSQDRIITTVDYWLQGLTSTQIPSGVGVASLVFTMSTSTDIYTASSANYLLNTTVATSTPQLWVASSTPGNANATTGGFVRVWKTGTYLNLFQNSTSTATGQLRIGYILNY